MVAARQKFLAAVGLAERMVTLEVPACTKSGPYLVGSAQVEVVSGQGPGVLEIMAERLRYWQQMP